MISYIKIDPNTLSVIVPLVGDFIKSLTSPTRRNGKSYGIREYNTHKDYLDEMIKSNIAGCCKSNSDLYYDMDKRTYCWASHIFFYTEEDMTAFKMKYSL